MNHENCNGGDAGNIDNCNVCLVNNRKKLQEALERVLAKPYLKTIGAKGSPHCTLEGLTSDGLTRSFRTIRLKDLSCILGKDDEMLQSIHGRSGASISVITELKVLQYDEAIIEFSGTAVEIERAIKYVSDAITTRYLGEHVPRAMMTPEFTFHEKMPLPLYQAAHLLNMTRLLEIEAKSFTWLMIEASEPPAHEKTSIIDIQISGTLENIRSAKIMINSIVSRAKTPKTFELKVGKFRWESSRENAAERFVGGCGDCRVKSQTRKDNKPTYILGPRHF